MKCVNQKLVNGILVSCGECPACCANETNALIIRYRATAAVTWKYFITLTYDNESLPYLGVFKDDLTQFIRDLSDAVGSFKYAAVAEYGGRFCRPHYHLNLFFYDYVENLWSLLEDIWSLGIVHVIDLNNDNEDLKRLNYIAKYHSTVILSQNIYRLADYPIFWRLDDDETYEAARHRLSLRLGLSDVDLNQYKIIKCAESFRCQSDFLGVEYLDSDEYKKNRSHNKFYCMNNRGQYSSLPSYYDDKLSIEDRVCKNLSNLDYAINRKENGIDILAVQLNNVDLANQIQYEKWLRNYQESVLERKRHKQKEL